MLSWTTVFGVALGLVAGFLLARLALKGSVESLVVEYRAVSEAHRQALERVAAHEAHAARLDTLWQEHEAATALFREQTEARIAALQTSCDTAMWELTALMTSTPQATPTAGHAGYDPAYYERIRELLRQINGNGTATPAAKPRNRAIDVE